MMSEHCKKRCAAWHVHGILQQRGRDCELGDYSGNVDSEIVFRTSMTLIHRY